MMSKHDLHCRPQEIQPLGSRKGLINKATDVKIDITELFLSKSNSDKLRSELFNIYQQNGGKSHRVSFYRLIFLLQKKFVGENDLTKYEMADFQTTQVYNYVDILRAINQDFHALVYKHFQWNIYNPFCDDIEVGPREQRQLKKSAEIDADDHGTLDLWREQFVQVLNRQYRDNNRIPVYRTSLQTRHLDRGNEGLRENDPNRSSLETQVRGYDMRQIGYDTLNYKKEEWFGF